MDSDDIFTLPVERIDFDAVRNFVLRMEALNALTESLVLELKSAPQRQNVVKAVAGLANADGGLILIGVSEDATLEDRFVGVDQNTFDSLVSQFRSVLGIDVFDFVEVVPVAMPATEQLIVLVRVNADEARRPVVVAGCVYVRMPGQTVPARRDEIVRLVGEQRLEPPGVLPIPQHTAPSDAMRYPFWKDEPQPELTIRMHGRLELPSRAVRRPWLSSAAKRAALDALNASQIPDRILLDEVREHEMTRSLWEFTGQHSLRVDLQNRLVQDYPLGFRPRRRAEAYLYREHRVLGMLLVTGFDGPAPGSDPLKLTLENLYDCILAGCMTTIRACREVAEALDVAAPIKLGVLEGWLQPSDDTVTVRGTTFTDLLVLHRWTRTPAQPLSAFSLLPAVPSTGDLSELNELVRQWLTLLWLDLGLSDFENDIDAMTLPIWAPKPA